MAGRNLPNLEASDPDYVNHLEIIGVEMNML